MAKSTTETLVKHYPQFTPEASVTLTVKRTQGNIMSVYMVDTRPGVSNEGWLYRRNWKRRGALAYVKTYIKNIKAGQ